MSHNLANVLDSFSPFFLELAQISNFYCQKYFRKQYQFSTKKDGSIVTTADIEIEKELCKKILERYPDHGIIAEESGNKNEKSEYVWVIDPIDGTISFRKGISLWGTLVALTYNKIPILDMIHLPYYQETLIGDNNNTLHYKGTEQSPSRVITSPIDNIQQSTVLCTDIINVKKYQHFSSFMHLINNTKVFRTWGDCFAYYLLATQRADVVLDPILSYWDKIALIPIIKGCNGVITDWHGNSPLKGNSIVASNFHLHKKVISLLSNNLDGL